MDKNKYKANYLIITVINGNNMINHNSKSNPISDNYYKHIYTCFNSYKFSLINFYFRFVKYASDKKTLFPM